MKQLCLVISLLLSGAFAGTYDDPQTLPNRVTMVHLFEWKWTEIARECETFLKDYGYGAVQISPPNEHILISSPPQPWWQRYQPVSYHLRSRSGSPSELADMVARCNRAGVRVIVDAVINHMVGAGQAGQGSDGCSFNGHAEESFPCVPYGPNDFNDRNCHTSSGNIENYNDANQVRNCRLVALLDLNQGTDYVRQKIVEYYNTLIDIGIAGFRIDAAKHMWPGDLQAIMAKTRNLNTDFFPPGQRPFVVQEVIDLGGEAIKGDEYINTGRVTNFKYGIYVADAVRKSGQNFKYFSTFGPTWGMQADDDALNFIDNHDNQRGTGGGGAVLTYKKGDQYIMAVTYMLAYAYGYPRVMSSYYFGDSQAEHDKGPPSSTQSFNADKTCASSSGWVCEHRWPAIRNMVKFREVVGPSTPAADFVASEDHRLAFRRGKNGFFALNNADQTWSKRFVTGLPQGTYCDVISGELRSGSCTGAKVDVDAQGLAQVSIPPGKTFAIHLCSKIGNSCEQPPPVLSTPRPTGTPGTTGPSDMRRTVIFVHKQTNPGQDVFIRGGIDQSRRPGCSDDAATSACAIPIVHKTQVPAEFRSYTDWSKNDRFLDWYGAELNQGSYNGIPAEGTPLAWSTNDPKIAGYQPLNHYGPHYWIVDTMMDCSRTYNGWFELKAYLKGGSGWEQDVAQSTCKGDVGGKAPFSSTNHVGQCGFINVFEFENPSCEISKF